MSKLVGSNNDRLCNTCEHNLVCKYIEKREEILSKIKAAISEYDETQYLQITFNCKFYSSTCYTSTTPIVR